MIRTGFVFRFEANDWLGGVSYYRNLFHALSSLEHRKIEPVIFVGSRINLPWVAEFSAFEIIQTSLLDQARQPCFLRRVFRRLFPFIHDRLQRQARDLQFKRLLRKYKISIISHVQDLTMDFGIPTIGWITDFQHKHLPGFFCNDEILERDRIFDVICRKCRRVLVSSYEAQKDLLRYFPQCGTKSRVLQFVASLPISNITSREQLENKYHFDQPYFYLPNHFWIHKNHLLVIEALKILKSQGYPVLVLLSGKQDDYRKSNYFDELMLKVDQYGLKGSFKPLGIIPYSDVLSLMRHSFCVINPSLFEGWSNTVEEAKTLGKTIILSDIPVHREQAYRDAYFFDPHSPESLSSQMKYVWDHRDSVDQLSTGELAKDHRRRLIRFAESYETIVRDALEETERINE